MSTYLTVYLNSLIYPIYNNILTPYFYYHYLLAFSNCFIRCQHGFTQIALRTPLSTIYNLLGSTDTTSIKLRHTILRSSSSIKVFFLSYNYCFWGFTFFFLLYVIWLINYSLHIFQIQILWLSTFKFYAPGMSLNSNFTFMAAKTFSFLRQ